MSKRNNELVGQELDIVSRSVSMQVTTFDEALSVFIKDAKRRGLREFTITYRPFAIYPRRTADAT